MLATTTINKTHLARQTRQVVEHVRRGRPVIVASRGQEQVAIVDALDYRLLRAAATYNALPPHEAPVWDVRLVPRGLRPDALKNVNAGDDPQTLWNQVLIAYLDGDISLGKAAQLLGFSRFELQERLNRLGLPLRLGAISIQEAKAEYNAVLS